MVTSPLLSTVYSLGLICFSSSKLATVLSPYLIRSPSYLIVVLLFLSPSLISLVSTLFKPLRSFANLTVKPPLDVLELPSPTTPILLSDRLFLSAPPLIFNVSPN